MKIVHLIAKLVIIAGLLMILGSFGALEKDLITFDRMYQQIVMGGIVVGLGFLVDYLAGEER